MERQVSGSASQQVSGFVLKLAETRFLLELGYGKISLFPCSRGIMLAKMTVKNQLTLPKAVISRFGGVEYFDVSTDGVSITLRPLRRSRLDEVRAKLDRLGITEHDIPEAIAWARQSK
jgi:hypothetical protein